MAKIYYKGVEFEMPSEDSTVYTPAEDSYLIANCALYRGSELLKSWNADKTKKKSRNEKVLSILELGTGSGFVSCIVKNYLENEIQKNGYTVEIRSVATDINPDAIEHAGKNGVEAYLTDVFSPLEENDFEEILKDKFDIILFNPPYLPTSEDEKIPGDLNYAFDGGEDGRKVIVPFLEEAGDHLKEDGFFLLLISSMTGLGAVAELMKNNGFSCKIVAIETFPYEKIIVLEGKKLENGEDFVIKESLIQNI